MRAQYNLNDAWKYFSGRAEGFEKETFDDGNWEEVRLPHTNREVPFRYFDDAICCFVSCYRRRLTLKKSSEKIYRICFEGISGAAKLYVNGSFVAEHKCAYTDFIKDITSFLSDGENVVSLEVDSREREDVPPFGGVVDYLCYGGIYRDVWLIETEKIYISDVYCRSEHPVADKDFLAEVTLCGGDDRVKLTLKNGDEEIYSCTAQSREKKVVFRTKNLPVRLWSTLSPTLYKVVVKTSSDEYSLRYGFREALFTEKGFFLNGERLQLTGLNRHQSFPYAGYAMPRNAQREDADILRKELGVNLVRTSHYPQSRHFLERCDEIGLLVFEEIPGWNHIGDEAWKAQTEKNLSAMILRDRSRPSVVLWGVRINESEDDHEFYTRTNRIARSLDTRQTAGVRWKPHSELLEDVFAVNDFVPLYEEPPLRDPRSETGLDRDVPYLVTEYMGHMFPTKSTDNEARLCRQAQRHAEIQNRARADERISGAIGWCAFDYHTHRHFGTNDKICYHGVMDMFRNPKYASFVYASQKPLSEGIVFEPATVWAFGERDIGGVVPLYIYTNVDEVVLSGEGREELHYFPARKKFPYLPHPPVVVEKMPEVWGSTWKDVTFRGLAEGKEVVSRTFSSNPVPDRLAVEIKTKKVTPGDSVRFKVCALDSCGNVMKFFDEVLRIEVDGGRLIGPDLLSLKGGMYSCWVIAEKRERIRLKASSPRLVEAEAEIAVEKVNENYYSI